MELFGRLSGFIGAWLLVAGPIYQAVLELQESSIERERIEAAGRSITPPQPVSGWWWLVPPVKLVLERRRSAAYREAYFKAMPADIMVQLVAFVDKATGWALVAAGGLLIAVKESAELVMHLHGSWLHLVVLIVLMLVIVVSFVGGSRRRRAGLLGFEPDKSRR